MKVLRRILLGLVATMCLFVLIVLLLPPVVHIERSTTIDAEPEVVFAVVSDLRRFQEWSPWQEPMTRQTFSGPASGVGAKVTWSSGPPDGGSGTYEITAVEAPRRVHTHLDLGGPAQTQLLIEPQDAGSSVTWAFNITFTGLESALGHNPVGRYVERSLDRAFGPNCERGLARLKKVAEADAARL